MISMSLTYLCWVRYPVHFAARQWNVKFQQSTKVKIAHRGLSPVSSASFHCLQLIQPSIRYSLSVIFKNLNVKQVVYFSTNFHITSLCLFTSRKYAEIGQSCVLCVTNILDCEKDITMKLAAMAMAMAMAQQIILWGLPGKYTIIYLHMNKCIIVTFCKFLSIFMFYELALGFLFHGDVTFTRKP